MQQSVPTRKRPAPGASPLVQQPMTPQPQSFPYQSTPENPDFSNFDFNSYPTEHPYTDTTFPDTTNYNNALSVSHPQAFGSTIAPAPSTDLVRRTRNQQLAPHNGQQDQWTGGAYGGQGNMPSQEEESERDLDMKVALAKRDAQGKRKQIPPFVQKLSSFLDSNNTELIRWSDDGRSFIVLDEDEFARTLIPELFKHNNYASFVRQLNMYGFHKTVNITDGSLRQSEKARKGVKPPSMYSHPYFRKNRPDLLWLIQKPTGKSGAKRKRDGAIKDGFDSDDERQFSPGPDGRPQGELGQTGGADIASMPRGELHAVRQEIKKLQQQQNLISRMIGQLKEQNDQFYRQATAFQALHDRHENSINAILTFLATFYNRSLEGHAGQNLVNMFGGQANQNNQQQGGVVEEYTENGSEGNNQVQRYVKRPQLLLAGPNDNGYNTPSPFQGSATTQPNSARPSVSPPHLDSPPIKRDSSYSAPPPGGSVSTTAGRSSSAPAVKTDAQTPNVLSQVPENDEMLSLINDINATTGTSNAPAQAYDWSALNNLSKNADTPLTPQQRDNMLSMMANHQGGTASDNNALTQPRVPDTFNMDQLKDNQQKIEQLQDMQERVNNSLAKVQEKIVPLSPSGSIPGLADDNNFFDSSSAPGQYDPNSFLNLPDEYGNDDINFAANMDNDFDWNFDTGVGAADSGADMFQTENVEAGDDGNLAPQQSGGLGTVESLSSEATSPAATVQEGEAATGEGDPGTPIKRQRRS